jgi:aminopeptidase N
MLGHAQAALGRYVPERLRDQEGHAFFRAAWDGLRAAEPGDPQLTWARALMATAIVREDHELAGRLVDGEESVPGLTIDQDMRWTTAVRWMAYGVPGARDRVEAEKQRDPSDRGQRMYLRAQVSEPSADIKAQAWNRFHGEGYGSLHLTAAAMSGFNWSCQQEILDPFVERFFSGVAGEFHARQDREFLSDYFSALFPSYRPDEPLLARSRQVLSEAGGMPLLMRMLLEANDELERAMRCRAFAEA